jgi:hypothetical protein
MIIWSCGNVQSFRKGIEILGLLDAFKSSGRTAHKTEDGKVITRDIKAPVNHGKKPPAPGSHADRQK